MLKPLADCVLIEPEATPTYAEQTGLKHIVVPEIYQYGPTDPPRWGQVAAKGEACKLPDLEVGSRVMFGKFAGQKLVWQNKEHYIVREYDILAKDLGHGH